MRALLATLALALSLSGCSSSDSSAIERLQLVRGLPYLEPADAPGLTLGKPVVVEFWATWCPPCVESVPHLVELDERLRSDGLVLIGVHSRRGAEDEANVRRFVEARHVEYPIALDREGQASRAFGVSGIPKAFVFDRDGALVWDGHPLDPAFTTAVEEVVRG